MAVLREKPELLCPDPSRNIPLPHGRCGRGGPADGLRSSPSGGYSDGKELPRLSQQRVGGLMWHQDHPSQS